MLGFVYALSQGGVLAEMAEKNPNIVVVSQDMGPLSPFSDGPDRGPLPNEEREGAHDNGLPCPCLAGEGVETWLQIQGQVVYDGVIPDPEFDEHGDQSRRPVRGTSMGKDAFSAEERDILPYP